jgi:hypothetical protein
MPATITRNITAPAVQITNVSYCKEYMTAIGIPTTAIVYETTTEAIYKITQGTGTYADIYMRWYLESYSNLGLSGWKFQVGTGFSANALTGVGADKGGFAVNSTNSSYSAPAFYTTVVSADGSYRQVLTFNSSFVHTGGFAIVKPTNTTLTASNAPLTYVLSGIGQLDTVRTPLQYIPPIANSLYGVASPPHFLGIRNASNVFTLPAQLGLTTAKAGSYGVVPNVPILSGGWPIGYNSNLAFVSTSFLPMDRVIVTAGTEEYVVVDAGTGIAVREV